MAKGRFVLAKLRGHARERTNDGENKKVVELQLPLTKSGFGCKGVNDS